ncbi:MAG TPA: methyltransferase domain-containing protein [Dehalococcoidia bacterium]|nr:methyltransferase domain-containing protein [Dehalococcoidia bacterium]
MLLKTNCLSCGSKQLMSFYELSNVPVNSNLLLPSRAEAVSFPRGEVRLAFCEDCGFIQNVLFNENRIEYSPAYLETRAVSPHLAQFLEEQAARLVKSYDLHNKDILEIGCGNGDFLARLCRLGPNRGVGIDPAYSPEARPAGQDEGLRFISDFYSDKYLGLSADFIACRHTLEHIAPVHEFVDLVRRAVGERRDTVVFFEVPDTARVLRELAFWDIYYEHCSYFSLGSLARLFRSCGFDVFDLQSGFDGQYLLIDSVAANGGDGPYWETEDDIAEMRGLVKYFRDNQPAKVKEWWQALRKARSGGKIALWGSGSKAISFLTTLGTRDELEFVVDINPANQGKFLPGSGHEIVAPEFLGEYQPDTVIAMNPAYQDEIRRHLDRLGVKAELTAV